MRPYPRRSRFATKRGLGQEGYVLPMVLVWSFVLVLEMGGLATYASTAARQVRIQRDRVQAFYLAEAAVQSAGAQIRSHLRNTGSLPQAADFDAMAANAPHLSYGFTYSDYSIAYDGGASALEQLENGDYAGLNGVRRTVAVTASARPAANLPPVRVDQEFEIQSIPIFQFGVFYQNDLEILPGANMTFGGAVHTNSDLYVGVGSGSAPSLSFESTITSAGGIYHERKDGSSIGSGSVYIDDAAGDAQAMYLNSQWLDSHSNSWAADSQSRWGGTVKSSDHGVPTLNLPLSTGIQPHELIERRSQSDSAQLIEQKMDYRAQLRIVDGQVLNQQGQTIELRYCTQNGTLLANGTCSNGVVVNPVASTSFYDAREQKTILTTEIDVSKLNSSPSFSTIVGQNNGVVVYFSDQRNPSSSTHNGLRLVNGSTLPANGVTFASENPMYVKGHYNSTAKKPAGLVADSLTLLSGNWNDANSAGSLNNRAAANTTVNAAVMTGNTETVSGQYNGGFENIHRLLENWSGRTLTYKGSVEVLYNSDTATGNWGQSNVYSAPNRNWSFDTDLLDDNNTVPGFPSVYNVAYGIWSRD